MRLRRTGAAALLFGGLAGCPRGGTAPLRPTVAGWSLGADAVGDGALRGVAVVPDGALIAGAGGVRRVGDDGRVAWTATVNGSAGALALDGEIAAVAVGGDGGTAVTGLDGGLRGEPGAAVVGLAAADGAARWTVGVGSSRWSVIAALAAAGDGFLIAGSFAGTLRIGDRTVTAAGGSDGFVAALDRAGAVRWLRRVGGDGADQLAGAAALGAGRVAIAGTFSGAAELGDVTLTAVVTDQLAADGFVAVLEADGRPAWTRVWGGEREDTCAGIAALAGGAVAVAGTVRGDVDVAGRRLSARGAADGLVAVFAGDGAVKSAWLIGGDDFDGITAVAGAGDRLALAGWWTGTLPVPGGSERAIGVDDAFVAIADLSATLAVIPLPSPDASPAVALAATPQGFAAAAPSALWFRGW